jgi:hypothetical protein
LLSTIGRPHYQFIIFDEDRSGNFDSGDKAEDGIAIDEIAELAR